MKNSRLILILLFCCLWINNCSIITKSHKFNHNKIKTQLLNKEIPEQDLELSFELSRITVKFIAIEDYELILEINKNEFDNLVTEALFSNVHMDKYIIFDGSIFNSKKYKIPFCLIKISKKYQTLTIFNSNTMM